MEINRSINRMVETKPRQDQNKQFLHESAKQEASHKSVDILLADTPTEASTDSAKVTFLKQQISNNEYTIDIKGIAKAIVESNAI